jgi:hypothetical protein
MSTAASFSSVRNQGLSFKEEKANTTEGDACKLRDSSGQIHKNFQKIPPRSKNGYAHRFDHLL